MNSFPGDLSNSTNCRTKDLPKEMPARQSPSQTNWYRRAIVTSSYLAHGACALPIQRCVPWHGSRRGLPSWRSFPVPAYEPPQALSRHDPQHPSERSCEQSEVARISVSFRGRHVSSSYLRIGFDQEQECWVASTLSGWRLSGDPTAVGALLSSRVPAVQCLDYVLLPSSYRTIDIA